MKLITLNIWGGHVRNPLLDFIKAHSDIDIFCFQEVYHNAKDKISTEDREASLNIFAELQTLLPEHNAFFRPVVESIYGVGALVKKNIDVLQEGDISIHVNPDYPGKGPTHSRNLQWLECCINKKIYSILNVHGLWNGMGKTDTPARIAQSKRIRDFMDTINTPKIICGDFNLRPDTESLRIIEKGMHNHIFLNKVQSTRTSLYSKNEKYADYIFTSNEIEVSQFAVLKDEVSDHAPLFLDFA
jgi:endonuclease/exonuclease/phosphatase family metal-dependent hydrolase